MKSVTGETLRPGGFQLIKRAADMLGISSGTKILDSGCGTGSSLEFLQREYHADVTGIDPSAAMLKAARKKNLINKSVSGASENIPYKDGSFDILLSECSLSHSKSIRSSIQEFSRVLVNKGFLVLCDLYARELKEPVEFLHEIQTDSGVLTSEEIKKIITEAGFKISALEDHTQLLTQLACDIIMKYGSMENFLEAASNEGCICTYRKAGNIKLGYYMLIAEKQ